MRILVIDDSKAVHAFLKVALSNSKFVITDTFNGAEGVEAYKSANGAFDLILLDWEMPVLDGPSTFEALLKLENEVPVVMMTTRNSPDDIALMLKKGVREYLLKPFTTDILLEKIEFVMDQEALRVS